MFKKKIIKIVLSLIGTAIIVAFLIGAFLFNKPHRNVQAAAIDFNTTASSLVAEYLKNPIASNEKYLSEEGNSKIIAVTGVVHSESIDQNDQTVVLLKKDSDKAGVSCTFTSATNAHAYHLTAGQSITVKGVIRSGAGFDKDLGLYEDVILEKCDVIQQ